MTTAELHTPAAATMWRVLAVAQRHWYVLRRSPHRLFDVVLWPVVDTLLFASIAVTGMILWQVVYQAQIALATGFLEETFTRSLLNLMASPLREWEYVTGMALFGLAKLLCGVSVVAALAWVAYAFDLTTLGVGLLPVAGLLLAVGWGIALFVIGLVLRFGTGAEALAWGILFTIMPLSGVFYPTQALPAPLRPLADVLPTTHAFAASRVLASGGAMPWHELAIAAAGTAALIVAGLTFVLWMLRRFRARGYVTRYS
jgi:ABC-2 type transport system permease protein